MFVVFVLLLLAASLGLSALIGEWTGWSLDVALPLIVHHAVHVPFWAAWIISTLLSAVAVPFDIVVTVLHAIGVI